jgi:hypothetical protein
MGERLRLDCEPRAEVTAERMIWSRRLIVSSLGTAGTTLMLQVGCLLLWLGALRAVLFGTAVTLGLAGATFRYG